MNDFTKQDLIDLHDLCYGGMHDDHPVEDWKLSLQIKIKSLIDNYDKPCDHPNCRRVSLLDGHDYDICPNCKYIRQMR